MAQKSADQPHLCATCEWWSQAHQDAFQMPLSGIWGMCRLTVTGRMITLTRNTYGCNEWMAD